MDIEHWDLVIFNGGFTRAFFCAIISIELVKDLTQKAKESIKISKVEWLKRTFGKNWVLIVATIFAILLTILLPRRYKKLKKGKRQRIK